MGKKCLGSVVFLIFLSAFAIVSTVSAQSNLVIVRASDDSLWKATCDGDSCSAFTSFPGMFRQQPSVTWDEKLEKWVVVGVASDSTIWKATFDKAGAFNNDWVRIPGSTPSPTGLAGGNLMEYGALRVRQDGFVPAYSSASIVIPHFVPFMLQVAHEWPDQYGVAVANGMENSNVVSITYTKYNGSHAGTSAYGGASCLVNNTNTLFSVGSCTVQCPGEASGELNLVIQAVSDLGCRYRVIY